MNFDSTKDFVLFAHNQSYDPSILMMQIQCDSLFKIHIFNSWPSSSKSRYFLQLSQPDLMGGYASGIDGDVEYNSARSKSIQIGLQFLDLMPSCHIKIIGNINLQCKKNTL